MFATIAREKANEIRSRLQPNCWPKEDPKSIDDNGTKAQCEARCLKLRLSTIHKRLGASFA